MSFSYSEVHITFYLYLCYFILQLLIIYVISAVLSLSALLLSYLSNKQAVLFMAVVLSAIVIGAHKLGIIGRKEKAYIKK